MKISRNLFLAVLCTSLLAGTLDAIGAIINYLVVYGKNPVRIFYYIASGIFGKEVYTGGSIMAILGLVFHYLIAFLFTSFFFLLASRIIWVQKHVVLSGIFYGILIWLAMNCIVLPFSNVMRGPFEAVQVIVGILILVLAVGIPISIRSSAYFHKAG